MNTDTNTKINAKTINLKKLASNEFQFQLDRNVFNGQYLPEYNTFLNLK